MVVYIYIYIYIERERERYQLINLITNTLKNIVKKVNEIKSLGS
jgi:hypothetical protein